MLKSRVKHGSSLSPFHEGGGGGKEASFLKSVRHELFFFKNIKMRYQDFLTTPKNAISGFSYSHFPLVKFR